MSVSAHIGLGPVLPEGVPYAVVIGLSSGHSHPPSPFFFNLFIHDLFKGIGVVL